MEKSKTANRRLYCGEKMSKSHPTQFITLPKFEDVKSPEYRTVYASGLFGGLDPNDARMIFFIDHIELETTNEPILARRS
jgi:hypothetical protein